MKALTNAEAKRLPLPKGMMLTNVTPLGGGSSTWVVEPTRLGADAPASKEECDKHADRLRFAA